MKLPENCEISDATEAAKASYKINLKKEVLK